jgi:hypothetical protein
MKKELQSSAKELLTTKLEKIELTKKELLQANSLSTNYLSDLYISIKDINNQKDKFKAIRDFKSQLLVDIKDDNKVLNTVLSTLNKALKNSNDTTINILKLSDFNIVSKFSNLSNNNQKAINNIDNLTKDILESKIIELLKIQNKEKNTNSEIKSLEKKGYKVTKI